VIPERWRKVRVLLGALRPWFDPSTQRPLLLIVFLSFAVLLGPLAVDLFWAWFFWIPRGIRWSLGQGAMVSAIALGVWRLCWVRPGDAWPLELPGAQTSGCPAARWMPWALRLAAASLAISILRNPQGLGFADWDFVLDKFEAVRRTIVIWGQFPWWNPWCRGGFPLAAEPQIGAVSMATPLILAFGTSIGLRIAAVACIGLAVEGAYRLAWLWLREPWAAAAAALVYGLNGAVSVNTADGYITAMSYCSLPWLAYHAFRIGEGFSQGVWLGFWAAFAILNGLQYLTLYAAVLTAAIWLRAVRVQPAGSRGRMIRSMLAAVGTFLALSGWRLATMLLVLLEDRRERVTHWDESLVSAIRSLLDRPRPDWPEFLHGVSWAPYTSLTSYVGVVVVMLVVSSLTRGWRWWHTLIVLTGWLAIGSIRWYHPSYWLADWPFFGSAHVVTRWRFVTMLGLGLAAGSVVARWRISEDRRARLLAAALTLAIGGDLVVLAHQQLPLAFSVRPEPRWFPGPPVREIVNVREGLGYPCVLRGYGVIEGYEPMISYYRNAPTLRRARDDPDYHGESWTAEGPVRPVFWSPNRLIFQVRPGQEVFINQNPGSWWLVNGQRVFAGRRCAEPMVPFAVKADYTGRIEIRIDPPGLWFGIVLDLIGAGLLATAWWRRSGPREGEAPTEPTGPRASPTKRGFPPHHWRSAYNMGQG
jgi:hypothetical protein